MKSLFKLKASKYLPITAYALYRDGVLMGTDLEVWVEVPLPIAGLPNDTLIKRDWLKIVMCAEPGPLTYADVAINGHALPETDMTASEFPMLQSCELAPVAFHGSLDAKTLKGVALAVSHQDVRYYLNGVFVDAAQRAIVGTDGHRMHVAELLDIQPTSACQLGLFQDQPRLREDDTGFILPIGAVEVLLAGCLETQKISFYSYAKPNIAVLKYGATTVRTKLIQGCYPDWQKVYKAAPVNHLEKPSSPVTLTLETGVARKAIQKHMKIAKATGDGSRGFYKNIRFRHRELNGTVSMSTDAVLLSGSEGIGLCGQNVIDALTFIDVARLQLTASIETGEAVHHVFGRHSNKSVAISTVKL